MLDRIVPTVVLAVAVATTGCYTGLVPYVAPRATIRGDRAALLQAIETGAHARGLRVVRLDPTRGELVAVSELEDIDGLQAREHWRFVADDDHVRVELHPETRSESVPARWERSEFVCDCYRYAREREMLREIRARIRQARRLAESPAAPGGA
jgi:hypothetical protein